MNKASLYYYVRSKDELARRLILRASQRLRDMARSSETEALPPAQALERLVRAHGAVLMDYPHEMGLLIQQRKYVSPDTLREISERERIYVAYLRGVIARGIAAGVFRKVDVGVATALVLDATKGACPVMRCLTPCALSSRAGWRQGRSGASAMRSDSRPVDFEIALTPEAYVRWCIGRDGRIVAPPAAGARIPLSYLVFLRAQPVLGVDFRELLGRDPDRGLYGGVSYRQMRPLTIGQRMEARSVVSSRRGVDSPRGRLVITQLLTTYRCEGVPYATEEVRMIDLPPAGDSPPAPEPREAYIPAHPALALAPPITRNQVAWLTVETGDTNALHLDGHYAARRHYPDVVVPATLITAVIEREIEQAVGLRMTELDVRYLAPSHPADAFAIHASRNGPELVFEAVVEQQLRAQGRCRLEA
jgi:AcrR family transcriptional regulator/acyl dehydratase